MMRDRRIGIDAEDAIAERGGEARVGPAGVTFPAASCRRRRRSRRAPACWRSSRRAGSASARRAAQNASSWYSYVGLRGNFSVRVVPPAFTRMRCQSCGDVGLITCISPRSPITRAYVWMTHFDHIEQVMRPV